ncbi:hypothetical protein Tco_0906547 [Tanacetum coccineum]|uniref:Uncharacterized protein n=1 Tax=Tanacetum coccineum TaxID=301880 RepID=A0ABQ5CIA4_9ASTR
MQACTIDRIMFSQLLDILVAKVKYNIWALFICIPGLDIDSGGLKLIESDADVHALYDLDEKHVKVDMFVAHSPQNLAVYYHKNLCLDGSDKEAEEEAKSMYLRSPPLKSRPFRNDMKGNVLFTDMYCAEDEGFEMTMSVSKNDASKYVEYTESITDGRNEGRNEGMNQGMNDGMNEGMNQADDIAISKKRKVVSRGNGISIKENDGHNVVLTDSESDYSNHSYKNSESDSDQSDKSFDYLSNGENEVIKLRKRMRQSKVNGTKVPDEVPRDEGTFAQGQDTTVDVDRFGEVDDTCVGLTPLIREHEKFTKALLWKLKGNRVGITDPFAILEDSKEKYPIYDDLTHRKLKKPKLGEKFPTVDKFKEYLTYYALANGFSLYFERSNKEKIVAKCGQRKEVIKDPSQGKQKAFKKYPFNNP